MSQPNKQHVIKVILLCECCNLTLFAAYCCEYRWGTIGFDPT